VVKTSTYGAGEAPRPFFYVPYQQFARFDLTIHVRTAPASDVLPAIATIAR
jgi:hypothetical protein